MAYATSGSVGNEPPSTASGWTDIQFASIELYTERKSVVYFRSPRSRSDRLG